MADLPFKLFLYFIGIACLIVAIFLIKDMGDRGRKHGVWSLLLPIAGAVVCVLALANFGDITKSAGKGISQVSNSKQQFDPNQYKVNNLLGK